MVGGNRDDIYPKNNKVDWKPTLILWERQGRTTGIAAAHPCIRTP